MPVIQSQTFYFKRFLRVQSDSPEAAALLDQAFALAATYAYSTITVKHDIYKIPRIRDACGFTEMNSQIKHIATLAQKPASLSQLLGKVRIRLKLVTNAIAPGLVFQRNNNVAGQLEKRIILYFSRLHTSSDVLCQTVLDLKKLTSGGKEWEILSVDDASEKPKFKQVTSSTSTNVLQNLLSNVLPPPLPTPPNGTDANVALAQEALAQVPGQTGNGTGVIVDPTARVTLPTDGTPVDQTAENSGVTP